MNESKCRSLGKLFSREEMVWWGRKCKWKKEMNSGNGGKKTKNKKTKKWGPKFTLFFSLRKGKNQEEWMKKNSKIFKNKWHQFQKKKEFNFEGEKNKFSRMIKNKECHFSKKKKKKSFSKGLQKSIKVFFSKEKIQIKKQMRITHLKAMEQQSTHHLKSNFKFWSLASKTPGAKVEKTLDYLPFKLR